MQCGCLKVLGKFKNLGSAQLARAADHTSTTMTTMSYMDAKYYGDEASGEGSGDAGGGRARAALASSLRASKDPLVRPDRLCSDPN